jgi:hypothetical protein
MMERSCESCQCEHSANRLAQIIRHDRVYILHTDLCGTVLYADDQFAFIGLDNTQYETTFALQELRLVGH